METEKTRKCTKSQAELAEQASSYMLERLDKKITINEISEKMHVSQTQLKNSFRNYYGESVYKYIRSRKMQMAADQLAEGQFSVMEIAGMFGYENCSKFAAAFRGEYGVSPSSYRKQHRVRSFPTQLPKTAQEQHLA
ncbi:MAG: AraC family transcriptional regulator [Lachnospiraceae bacterium]|nr:AraC family transcriptional regulator [Lachnospiraceae bacterium]